MIPKDSEITNFNEEDLKNNSEEVFELIHSTSHSLLYRMRKDGKYFIVKQSVTADEDGRKILRREYEISIGLSHPNIIDVYEYRADPDSHDSIVMEYVEGRTLSEFLAESPSLKTRKRIFLELLDAVDYLHQHRIIHNDIKPGNIIISRNGDRLKLIDLGLSDTDMHYALRSMGFTKGFSAPELIAEGRSDFRSDIYSIGMIGRLLFGSKFRHIFKKCLHEKPEKRYADIRSLRTSWERNRRKWMILLIMLCAGIITGGIWFVFDIQKQRLSDLEGTIASQSATLERQLEINQQLNQSYLNVKDSLNMIIYDLSRHEELKQKKLSEFKEKIKRYALLSLDTIKQCTTDDTYIRINFKNKVDALYNAEEKIVDGEDIGPQLHSIMWSEMEKAFDQFNLHSPIFRSYKEE